MVATINMYDAKTHLSQLVDRAVAGEDIVIARAGKPLVRLVPLATKQMRKGGQLKGLEIPDGFFFDPLPEGELQLWEGGGDREERKNRA